jgi:hypothetical protein
MVGSQPAAERVRHYAKIIVEKIDPKQADALCTNAARRSQVAPDELKEQLRSSDQEVRHHAYAVLMALCEETRSERLYRRDGASSAKDSGSAKNPARKGKRVPTSTMSSARVVDTARTPEGWRAPGERRPKSPRRPVTNGWDKRGGDRPASSTPATGEPPAKKYAPVGSPNAQPHDRTATGTQVGGAGKRRAGKKAGK